MSSDGHRWLTGQYTTENEETHWPASYGGKRQDSGDDPAVIKDFPGRIGFTDANASPEPNDYNEQGGIMLHLSRHGKSFVNFGNGFEFAVIDEPRGGDPTGAREHVNVPMEKVIRDNSDQLFPTFNTHIPDAPLPEDPGRFNRYDRFKQVFEAQYVDRQRSVCRLPQYVDLYYPNDHGGGARDINPNGPDWSFKRFVQDNDAALGLTVELISNSPCWKDTVIFVVEDDTQNGADHVDGHRSIFLAVSPWVKKQYVSKTHTSLASIFKTVDLILGIPPLNQYDAVATDLRDMFTATPDFTPYNFQQIQYAALPNPLWFALTRDIDFSHPDRDELKLQAAIMKSEGLPRRRRRQESRRRRLEDPVRFSLLVALIVGTAMPVAAQERPFLFSVTTGPQEKPAARFDYDVGVGEHAFQSDTANQPEQRLGVQASYGRLTFLGRLGVATAGSSYQSSQSGEVLYSLLRSASPLSVAAGGGVLHEPDGVNVLLARVVAGPKHRFLAA